MPKIKTNRSAAKRFSLTGSGKVRRRKQNLRHILTKKSAKRKRNLRKATSVFKGEMKAIRHMIQ